jgi:hypothetical protein
LSFSADSFLGSFEHGWRWEKCIQFYVVQKRHRQSAKDLSISSPISLLTQVPEVFRCNTRDKKAVRPELDGSSHVFKYLTEVAANSGFGIVPKMEMADARFGTFGG